VKAAITGTVEGGPEAGAVKAAKTEVKQRGTGAGGKRAPRAKRTPLTKTRTFRAGKQAHSALIGRENGGVLLGEYLIGGLVIVVSVFTKGTGKGYTDTVSEILLRLSALTAAFFVLFLLANNAKAGKAVAWFGLLIDVGIIFTAYQESEFTVLTDIIKGNPTGVDQTVLLKSTNVPEPTPEPLPEMQLS
jgi:hypothetical protein